MPFPTPSRSIRATIRNGSTPSCSTGPNCGVRKPTLPSKSPLTLSSLILSLRDFSAHSGARSLRSLDRNEQSVRQATQAVPDIPRDREGPVFREPWEAQAFAMTLTLYDRGLFTWPEWAATLAAEIKRTQAA